VRQLSLASDCVHALFIYFIYYQARRRSTREKHIVDKIVTKTAKPVKKTQKKTLVPKIENNFSIEK